MTSDRTAAMMVTRTRASKAGTMVPTLSIQPADALIDVPRGIRVEHVAPGQTVEITRSPAATACCGKATPPSSRARTAAWT